MRVTNWLQALKKNTSSKRRAKTAAQSQSESLEARELLTGLAISAKEQLAIENINRARANPSAEAGRLGIDLNAGLAAGTITAEAKQPVAPTRALGDAARAEADKLAAADRFAPEAKGARVAAAAVPAADLDKAGERAATAKVAPLGAAAPFNAFVIGDMDMRSSDAGGRLAVGGNAVLNGFGVASRLRSPIESPNGLVVRGELEHTGKVFEGETVVGEPSPINFKDAANALKERSASIKAMPKTHDTEITPAKGVVMDATNDKVDRAVFEVTAAQLGEATKFDIKADEGDTVLVNVSGESLDISNMQMTVNGRALQPGEEAPFHLLVNVPDATTMRTNAFSWQGSVLAPEADYQFDNGHINGQLVVARCGGTGEFHDFYFDGDLPDAPKPMAAAAAATSAFLDPPTRAEMLKDSHGEIGVGVKTGSITRGGETFETTTSVRSFKAPEADTQYITGVVYRDTVVDDDFYSIGEGVSEPTVQAIAEDGTTYDGASATSGGYSISVPAGTYDVVVTAGENSYIRKGVEIGDKNVKADFELTTATPHVELSFELDAPYVAERQTMTGTVTRKGGDTAAPYVVNISSADDLTVPETVTIPAGETSADFEITGKDDDALEGTELATIRMTGAASKDIRPQVPVREVQKLVPSDADGGDNTGHAIAMDGDIAVVGARFADVDGIKQSGTVYVYQRGEANKWTEVAAIKAPDRGAGDKAGGDRFGSAVAIKGDTLVVGAVLEEGAGEAKNSGAAYVFQRNAGGDDKWGLVQRIAPAEKELGDQFGSSVALDGNNLVIGARIADGDTKKNTGAVYVFEKKADKDGKESFQQAAVLRDAESARGDQFGHRVDIDGDHLIVGAPFTDKEGADTGTAYVYEKKDGAWDLARKIEAPDREGDVSGGDRFGHSVAIDGNVAVVGAYAEEDSRADLSSGAAYVFRKDASDDTPWAQVARLRPTDSAKRDHFGYSVDIDDNRILVGSRLKDSKEAGAAKAGAGYVFERQGETDTWTQIDKLEAHDAKAKDNAGSAVALSGKFAAVGAEFSDTVGGNAGSAYVFYSKATESKKRSPLLAATAGEDRSGLTPLSLDQLRPIVQAAIDVWRSTPLTASQMASLDSFDISIADLSGLRLGEADRSGIIIDDNAAGHGWYVDQTPYDLTDDVIDGRMDLLTTVKHEIGHVLGLDDTYDTSRSTDLMYGFLTEGERRSVFSDLDTLFSQLGAM